MKIHQILDEHSVIDPGIRAALEKKGYKYIKKGVDQAAFLEPNGQIVLKIFGTQDYARAPKKKKDKPVFSDDHMMFFRWAKYCNKHSSNPFLPKFSGAESFYWNGHVYLQIRQERLYKLNKSMGKLLETMADLTDDYDDFDDEMLGYLMIYHNGALNVLKNKVGMEGIKLLYKTLVKLEEIGFGHGWTLDLHRRNFRMRRDGTPVIVDPWVV